MNVTTTGSQAFTGVVSVDREKKQAKIIVAKDKTDGSVSVSLKDLPFEPDNMSIDLYKITKKENNGLEYRESIRPEAVKNRDFSFVISDVQADDTYMANVKMQDAKPAFFVPMTPDDGEVSKTTPILMWSSSVGAETYTLTISNNRDLSEPAVQKEGLTEPEYKVTEPLEKDINHPQAGRKENILCKDTGISHIR